MKVKVNLDLDSNKIINLADPTSPQDAVTKAYTDALANGVDWKASVRLATTAALAANTRVGNVLTANANGALANIDGVAAIVGDYILVKDEATGANNGLYVVTDLGSGGTPWIFTRREDANANAEVTPALGVFVEEGTTNHDSGWKLQTDAPIVVNTTALVFTQFTGLGDITAGAGLTKTGNTLDIGQGAGIIVNANDVAIDTSVVVKKFTALIGDGAATTIAVAHNLNNQFVTCQIYDAATNAQIWADVVQTNANTVTITFALAPAVNAYRVVVTG